MLRSPLLLVIVAALAAGSANAQPPSSTAIATDDQPPQGEIQIEVPSTYEARIKEQLRISIRATAPGGAPLTFSIAGAPRGARLVPSGQVAELQWTPRDEDVGVHDMTITVTDGKRTATKDFSVVVVEEWKSAFMPGLQYSAYGPNAASTYGSFHGVSAEFLLAAWIARNENRGPSHGRFYIDLDVLFSTQSGNGSAFIPTIGLDLSIERNPYRRWFLPYFGTEIGGVFQRQIDRVAIVVPFVGLHLYASPNVFANLTTGYALPIDAPRFDDLRGWRVKLGIDFSLW
jgi:hypothetical protein